MPAVSFEFNLPTISREEFMDKCVYAFEVAKSQGIPEPYAIHVSDKLAKKLGFVMPDYVKIIEYAS